MDELKVFKEEIKKAIMMMQQYSIVASQESAMLEELVGHLNAAADSIPFANMTKLRHTAEQFSKGAEVEKNNAKTLIESAKLLQNMLHAIEGVESE